MDPFVLVAVWLVVGLTVGFFVGRANGAPMIDHEVTIDEAIARLNKHDRAPFGTKLLGSHVRLIVPNSQVDLIQKIHDAFRKFNAQIETLAQLAVDACDVEIKKLNDETLAKESSEHEKHRQHEEKMETMRVQGAKDVAEIHARRYQPAHALPAPVAESSFVGQKRRGRSRLPAPEAVASEAAPVKDAEKA